MLIDLLSTSNYVSYNIKLAELLGLHTAIYLSELMNINDKAIRKNKLDDNYFKLKREYIKDRTTLEEKEQLSIEENLIKLGILEKGNTEDELSLNITTLTTIMMSADEQLIDNIKKLNKVKNKKTTKKEQIKLNLKKSLIVENIELREAYEKWIDAVYEKEGWMTKEAVNYGQEIIDNASNRDLDIALGILKVATVNAYRDMSWAVNAYKAQYKVNYKIKNQTAPTIQKATELSSEVF